MIIIDTPAAEALWGPEALAAQETVLTPELLQEIEEDRAMAIQNRLAREHEKRIQQAAPNRKEKQAAQDELLKTIDRWETEITNCERPSYGFQWSDYAFEGWDEFLSGCPWPGGLRDHLAQMLLNYQTHSVVSPQWLDHISATDQRFRDISMETPLSKEEMFDHLRPNQRPFDPQTQWYYYRQAKDYPESLKGISWVEWYFNHHDPYQFALLDQQAAHSINPQYVRFSWRAWKAGKYAEHSQVDWANVFQYHRQGLVVTKADVESWQYAGHVAHTDTRWYSHLIGEQFLGPERLFCNDWGEPVTSVFYLARQIQLRARKRWALPDDLMHAENSPLTQGTRVFHLGHGLGTVLEMSQEEDTIVVSTDKYGIKTYRLSYVLMHKFLFVVEPRLSSDSHS